MFINPKTAIEKGWLKFPEWMDSPQQNKCVQPNAVDFTLDRVFNVNHKVVFEISETAKLMRGGDEILPRSTYARFREDKRVDIKENQWALEYGMYDCLSDFYVDLPEGVAAMMVTRSTFVRNGLFWISGLFDSGFKGHIGGVLHNRSGKAVVTEHTRVGQIIFVASDSAGVYSGGWSHDVGTHYSEGIK